MTEILLRGIKHAKRIIITVIGFTILVIGIAMIVLPGPAIVVIPIGLGILATEFVWARRLLTKAKSTFSKITNKGGNINETK
jgi:tellurite resistance protein TerC